MFRLPILKKFFLKCQAKLDFFQNERKILGKIKITKVNFLMNFARSPHQKRVEQEMFV
jgi:hypothetical protein